MFSLLNQKKVLRIADKHLKALSIFIYPTVITLPSCNEYPAGVACFRVREGWSIDKKLYIEEISEENSK